MNCPICNSCMTIVTVSRIDATFAEIHALCTLPSRCLTEVRVEVEISKLDRITIAGKYPRTQAENIKNGVDNV